MKKLDTEKILCRFYAPGSDGFKILTDHSMMVAEKAILVAGRVAHLNPDTDFIYEAAMLHDIGIFKTDSPGFGCHGDYSYIFHGVLGREILDSLGLPKHGLVAERHSGSGITAEEISERGLGLPVRDMIPETIEEIIVCYADKFYSKSTHQNDREKTIGEIIEGLKIFGKRHIDIFLSWTDFFGENRYG